MKSLVLDLRVMSFLGLLSLGLGYSTISKADAAPDMAHTLTIQVSCPMQDTCNKIRAKPIYLEGAGVMRTDLAGIVKVDTLDYPYVAEHGIRVSLVLPNHQVLAGCTTLNFPADFTKLNKINFEGSALTQDCPR